MRRGSVWARLALLVCTLFAVPCVALAGESRSIVREVTIAAPPSVVWGHWTTLEGLRTLFIPDGGPLQGHVELRSEGPLELYFLIENPAGERGTEGSRFFAIQQDRMLAFTWRNAPFWPDLRPYYTFVVLTLEPVPEGTRLTFRQSGFGEGEAWDAAYTYFSGAWTRVIGRLEAHYATGTTAPAQ